MKAYFSVLVFVALFGSSVLAGTGSYCSTRDSIRQDLNMALSQTLSTNGGSIVTTDTIAACKNLQKGTSASVALLISDDKFNKNLSIPQLRSKAYIAMKLVSAGQTSAVRLQRTASIEGDTMILNPVRTVPQGVAVAVRACAECPFMSVLAMSDQRLSLSLTLSALLWALFSVYSLRHRNTRLAIQSNIVENVEVTSINQSTLGGLRLDPIVGGFTDVVGNRVNLTPMQQQLLEMFFKSPSHRLQKQEICDVLWPHKPDASETLYTLIRRLKPILECNSQLKIESERGRAYFLSIKEES